MAVEYWALATLCAVAALNRGRHLYSAGRPSRWAFAHILLLPFFLFFLRLISAVADWMSPHGVALVRISDANLKRAARGSLKMHDAKKSPKIAIWALSHNFDGLYLRN